MTTNIRQAKSPIDLRQTVRQLLDEMRTEIEKRKGYSPRAEWISTTIEAILLSATEPLPVEIDWGRGHFTRQETKLISFLFARIGKAIARDTLLSAMYWERPGFEADPKSIDIWICKLRRKLRDLGEPYSIETVWGFGLRMVSAPSH